MKNLIIPFLSVIILSGCFNSASESLSFPIYEDLETQSFSGKIESISVSEGVKSYTLTVPGNPVVTLKSNVIDLQEYEGQTIKVIGYFKESDQESQVFWVQRTDAKAKEEEVPEEPVITQKPPAEELEIQMEKIETENYLFQYPKEWRLSKDSGSLIFYKTEEPKEDTSEENQETEEAPEVIETKILEFNIETELPSNFVPDIQYQGLKGQRSSGKTLLYSDVTKRIYTFSYSEDAHPTEELELILKSFQEVQKPETEEEVSEESEDIKKESPETEESTETEKNTEQTEEQTKEAESPLESSEFKNLIDEDSWVYESEHTGVSLKIPKGYWFHNFGGQSNGSLIYLAIAKNEIETPADANTFVSLFNGEKPSQNVVSGDKIKLYFQGNSEQYYLIEGPADQQDLMMSIGSSIK